MQIGLVCCAFAHVLVVPIVAHHLATSGTQPNQHKNAGNAHQDIDYAFQPANAHGDPRYKIELENTHKQPVERAHDCENKRNHRENVECFAQFVFLLVCCTVSMGRRKENMQKKNDGVLRINSAGANPRPTMEQTIRR